MTIQTVKILIAIALLAQSATAALWNVDFGSDTRGGGPPPPMKTGFAATGISASDYWNFYSDDYPDGSYKADGYLANLKNSANVTTGVGIIVNNGDGAWGYASSDPMLANYIYSLSDGTLQTIVTVTNLPAGNYNFYLYGADSHFDLQVGATDYGTKTSYDTIVNPPPWVEGQEYVRYANVPVGAGQSVVLTPGTGTGYPNGIIGGMQIELVPEPGCAAMLGIAGLFGILRSRKVF